MIQRITPDMPREVAQRIAYEVQGDLKARWKLIDFAEACINQNTKLGRRAATSLIHAERYLSDREEYTKNPWPKRMIDLPYIYRGGLELVPPTTEGSN